MSYCIFQNIIIGLDQIIYKLEEMQGLTTLEIQEYLSDDEFKAYTEFLGHFQKINQLINK